MMAYTEDHIALAAEYVLGTLDADERAQVDTMMAVDPAFADVVQAWAFRLGVLNQMVGSVEPRPIVWENIRSEIARTALSQASLQVSSQASSQISPQESSETPPLPQGPPTPPDTPAPPPVLEPSAPEPASSEAPPPEPPRSEPGADLTAQFVPQTHAPDPRIVPVSQVPVTDGSNVIRLEGRVKRWRNVA